MNIKNTYYLYHWIINSIRYFSLLQLINYHDKRLILAGSLLPVLVKEWEIGSGNSYKLRLISLSWRTTVYREIRGLDQHHLDIRLLNYLKHHDTHLFGIKTSYESGRIRTYLKLSASRRLLPTRVKTLDVYLETLAESFGMTTAQAVNYEYKAGCRYQITGWDHQPYIQKLYKTIEAENYIGLQVHQQVEYVSASNNQYRNTLFFDLSRDSNLNKRRLKIIISTLSSNLKITRRGGKRGKRLSASDTLKFVKIPDLRKFTQQKVKLDNHLPENFDFQYHLGWVIQDQRIGPDVGISAGDLGRGGIIVGRIGTGKTTLRLHLMKLLLDQQYCMIDFDIKGDACKYAEFTQTGTVLVPKKNFKLNPFSIPDGYRARDYAGIILKILLESVEESLSPQQQYILEKAVLQTVGNKGNPRDFFRNIMICSYQARDVVENYQENSALALLAKFNWLQASLGDIYWTDTNSLDETTFQNESLFFDLSYLKDSVSNNLLKIFINTVLCRLSVLTHNHQSTSKRVILLDEAQLLLPNHQKSSLNYLEEIITTMRYKGVSVIAAGVSADFISSTLRDTGFIAQFQSESLTLAKALGLHSEQLQVIHHLDNYCSIIRSEKTELPIQVKLRDFPGTRTQPQAKGSTMQKRLPEFVLSKESKDELELLSYFLPLLSIRSDLYWNLYHTTEILVKHLVNNLFQTHKYLSNQDFATLLIGLNVSENPNNTHISENIDLSYVFSLFHLYKRGIITINRSNLANYVKSRFEINDKKEYIMQRAERIGIDKTLLKILSKYCKSGNYEIIQLEPFPGADFRCENSQEIRYVKHFSNKKDLDLNFIRNREFSYFDLVQVIGQEIKIMPIPRTQITDKIQSLANPTT